MAVRLEEGQETLAGRDPREREERVAMFVHPTKGKGRSFRLLEVYTGGGVRNLNDREGEENGHLREGGKLFFFLQRGGRGIL